MSCVASGISNSKFFYPLVKSWLEGTDVILISFELANPCFTSLFLTLPPQSTSESSGKQETREERCHSESKTRIEVLKCNYVISHRSKDDTRATDYCLFTFKALFVF